MKRLLVTSVYGPTSRNTVWYRLQREYLNRHTGCEYDMAVVLNEAPPSLLDPDVHVIVHRPLNFGHIDGMQQLLQYCLSVDYEYYLILDSDCFPIWPRWLDVLTGLMQQFGKEFAAPIRFENFDVFPHPCAFLASHRGLHDGPLSFDHRPTTNLLGEKFEENQFNQIDALPLLRSNVWSPHPLWAAVYHHLFYHHGAGTRVARSRATTNGYLRHYLTDEQHPKIEKQLFRELRKNPDAYLNRLLHGAEAGGDVVPAAGTPRFAERFSSMLQRWTGRNGRS